MIYLKRFNEKLTDEQLDLRTFSNLSIQGNVGSIKLEILEEVEKD